MLMQNTPAIKTLKYVIIFNYSFEVDESKTILSIVHYLQVSIRDAYFSDMEEKIKIGIIGAGSMGTGIAQVATTAGHEVLIYDMQETQIQKSQQSTQKILNRLVEKGRLEQEEMIAIWGRYYYVNELSSLADCTLIIEAIVENINIKKSIFTSLEEIVNDSVIIASNTSSLSITALAAALKLPDRFIGIHFFNPAALMKLVEIIPAIQTDPQIVDYVEELISSWNKLPVLVKDTPGFIVNRVARPFYGEALRIYEEGIADIPTIDWAMKEIGGFRMGPFTLMDYIGNDVNYTVTETVYNAFYQDPRYTPSFTQQRLSQAGYLGRKSGKGYYDYSNQADNAEPNRDVSLGQEIVDRIVVMLINEAADALYLNIASRDDIDTAMQKGVNYPQGLLQWADAIGIKTCVDRLDDLFHFYHEPRYRCSPLLRIMARDQKTFYDA